MGETNATEEFEAIKTIHDALKPLRVDGQRRVIKYISSLLGISNVETTSDSIDSTSDVKKPHSIPRPMHTEKETFGSFAELYDAVSPHTNADKALVAGYWLQVCEGGESFDSHSAHNELKHLGHRLSNITAALTKLKEVNPALVLQLKKSGTSMQARKTYKLTAAGVKVLHEMLDLHEGG